MFVAYSKLTAILVIYFLFSAFATDLSGTLAGLYFTPHLVEPPKLSWRFFIDLIALAFVSIISKIAEGATTQKTGYLSPRGRGSIALIIILSILPALFTIATSPAVSYKANPILCLINALGYRLFILLALFSGGAFSFAIAYKLG